MSLVSLSVLEGHGAECREFLYFVVRKRKLGGNAGWRGGHAYHMTNGVSGSRKTCFRHGNGWCLRAWLVSRIESDCVMGPQKCFSACVNICFFDLNRS